MPAPLDRPSPQHDTPTGYSRRAELPSRPDRRHGIRARQLPRTGTSLWTHAAAIGSAKVDLYNLPEAAMTGAPGEYLPTSVSRLRRHCTARLEYATRVRSGLARLCTARRVTPGRSRPSTRRVRICVNSPAR